MKTCSLSLLSKTPNVFPRLVSDFKHLINQPTHKVTDYVARIEKEKNKNLTSVSMSLVEKLCACMQVSKGSDAQAVGGMKLRLQEFATNLTHIHQLEEAGCRQQYLIFVFFKKSQKVELAVYLHSHSLCTQLKTSSAQQVCYSVS